MCYDVSLNQRFWNDYSVSNQDAPAVRHVVYHHHNARLLTVHHAKCAATHKQKDITSPNIYTWTREFEAIPCTHNETLPSAARLNTTLPRAATPALWPCLREDSVRGSRLPIWPEGEWNSGEEQGPSSDTLRLESIFCNRLGFVFPCRDKDRGYGKL